MLASQLVTTTLLSIGWLPTGLRWSPGDQPVPYCISANATRTSLSPAAQRQEVLNAINVWVSTGQGGSLSCSTYSVTNATFTCSVGIDTGDRQPNIFWERNWTSGSQTIGVTWSTSQGGPGSCGSVVDDTGTNHSLRCKWDSDIEFNDVQYTWTNSGQGGTDIASIAAHEYGHFIGLDHCNTNNTCSPGTAIMYANYIGGALRVPSNDDVQGGCGLYQGQTGGLGWPCTNNNQCNSNICVDPGPNGYCSQSCGNCPTGYICGNAANPNVCIRDDGRNRGVCEVCQGGIPDACANNGLCVGGFPSPNEGRCVQPCGGGGTCDPLFRCVTYTDGNGQTLGDFCVPRSSNCNDLNNINELSIGQRCGQNTPPCEPQLTCVSSGQDGICTQDCSGGGACPQGFACETFQGGQGWCLPAVGEGDSCSDIFVSCGTGPCLRNPANGALTCYLDCAGNPSTCNNAQTCNTYNLQGGGTVSVCEPPGVPPNPPDGGVIIRDAGPGQPGRDAGVNNPNRDAGVGVNPTRDAGMSTTNPPQPQYCLCDTTYECDADPNAGGTACQCDVECMCECDLSYSCDPGCGYCDPECGGGTCNCTETHAAGATAGGTLAIGLLFGLLMVARRRRTR